MEYLQNSVLSRQRGWKWAEGRASLGRALKGNLSYGPRSGGGERASQAVTSARKKDPRRNDYGVGTKGMTRFW